MLCANLPLTYPLIQRIFKLKNWTGHSYNGRYLSGSLPRHTNRSGLRSQRKSGIGLKSGISHTPGGISKTVSVNVVSSRGGELQRSESEERINVPSIPKTFDGVSHAGLSWPSGPRSDMGERSIGSQKTEGSVASASASIKSFERKH